MLKGIYKNHKFGSKFLIFIGLILIGFGVSTILGFIGVQLIFGIDVLRNPSLISDFSNIEVVDALKFMQFLNSVGIFVFPPLLFAYMVSDNFKKYLSLNLKPGSFYTILIVLIMFDTLPVINYLIEINEQMSLPDSLQGVEQWMRNKEDTAGLITKSFLAMDSFPSYLINLLIIALIPALGEELLFRGLIQKKISEKFRNYHLGIWITAFLFSAMHMQFFGFLPRFLLGALFGYMFVWSGSLWVPIIAHLINNGGAVTLQYILGTEFTEEHVDSFGTESGEWTFLILSLFILTYLLYLSWKNRIRV